MGRVEFRKWAPDPLPGCGRGQRSQANASGPRPGGQVERTPYEGKGEESQGWRREYLRPRQPCQPQSIPATRCALRR